MKGHLIANRKTEAALGLAAFGLGALLLWDAYDRRGISTPRLMRPFSFW